MLSRVLLQPGQKVIVKGAPGDIVVKIDEARSRRVELVPFESSATHETIWINTTMVVAVEAVSGSWFRRSGRTYDAGKPVADVRIVYAELARQRMRDEYRRGLEDGTLIALDMIEGRANHGGVPYSGPLPDELRAYIARVRVNAV